MTAAVRPAWADEPQTLRKQRGHDFWPSADEFAAVPALYDTEAIDSADKIVHLHYFVAGHDWYVLELEHDSGMAFTWATSSMCPEGELGYTNLQELETITAHAPVRDGGGGFLGRLPLVVERDLYWDKKPLGEVAPRLREPRPTRPATGISGPADAGVGLGGLS